MKNSIFQKSIIALLFPLVFVACKKEASTVVDYTQEASMQSDDQSQFSSEIDGIANDANLALESETGFTGRTSQSQTNFCNATATVDTLSNPRTITISYNGTSCMGYTARTGSIVLSMPAGTRWKNPGAAITISYNNLKITRLIDNKSITINGSHLYSNVSGGLLINLPTLQSITHSITSSNMSVSFNNGTERNWQVAKQRVFAYNNGVVITTTGTHNEGGLTGIAEWGTNRFGHSFSSSITEPLVFRQDCSFRLTSGKVEHKTALVNINATFGLDASGNSTGCPGTGRYFMKIDWTGVGGNTHSAIMPY